MSNLPNVSGSTSYTLGMDVSHYQGTINWSTAQAAGIQFAFIKVSEGQTSTDANAATYAQGAHAAGIAFGFYHFARLSYNPYSLSEADTEAQNFVNAMSTTMATAGLSGYGDLFPVLDLEQPIHSDGTTTGFGITATDVVNWAKEFCDKVTALTGRVCAIYTSTGYFVQAWNNFNGTSDPIRYLPLWGAAWIESGATGVPAGGGWSQWAVWQYTDQGAGSTYGVGSTTVDLDHGPNDLVWLKPPSKPTGLTYSNVLSDRFDLSWMDNPEADVKNQKGSYNVYLNGVWKANIFGTSATITGLSSSTPYSVTLAAVDYYGDVSPQTSALPITTVASQPSGGGGGGGGTLVSITNGSGNVQILIDGVDYTQYVNFETVDVDNNVIMTQDTIDFSVQINPCADSISRPMAGQEIVWQNPNMIVQAPDGTNQPYREFGGVVQTVEETVDGIEMVYVVHGVAYVSWLDRHLVTYWYSEDKPENIIANKGGTQPNALIPAWANKNGAGSFTTYNVQSTHITIIPQYFDHSKISEALRTIADQIEYGYYVDYYKDLHFYAAESFVSPLPNNLLNVDTDFQNYSDLKIAEDGSQVYNTIYLKGFKTRSAGVYVMPFAGDGATVQWSLGYRASSYSGDIMAAVFPSMAAYQSDSSFQGGGDPVNGTKLTMARDLLDGAPDQASAANTCYIHYTQHLVRVPNYNGGPIPGGSVLGIRFHYLVDRVYIASDPVAQRQIKAVEGTYSDGVYEYVHQDKSLTNATISAVQAKGQLLMLKYGRPQITGEFQTYFNSGSATGWRAGQHFYIQSTKRFGGQFAGGKNGTKLTLGSGSQATTLTYSNRMYVQRVSKKIVKNDSNEYVTQNTIEFADSPYLV